MIRFCAIFNILIGIIGLLFCFWYSWLALGLSGGIGSIPARSVLELTRTVGPGGIAGILYSWSGINLWRSLPSVHRRSVVLLGAAFCFSLAYCIQFGFITLYDMLEASRNGQAVDPYDEEIVMFVIIPTAVLLLALIQFDYLRRKSKK